MLEKLHVYGASPMQAAVGSRTVNSMLQHTLYGMSRAWNGTTVECGVNAIWRDAEEQQCWHSDASPSARTRTC